MPSNFYYHFQNFVKFSDLAVDWHIKGWKFKRGSDEWIICQLKSRIFRNKAYKHLITANRVLQKWTQ